MQTCVSPVEKLKSNKKTTVGCGQLAIEVRIPDNAHALYQAESTNQWRPCRFSRNITLWTRSGPEGSSRSRRRVCRDVAGSASTLYIHFLFYFPRFFILILFILFCVLHSFIDDITLLMGCSIGIKAHVDKRALLVFMALLNNSESCCFAKPVLVENACVLRCTVFS